MKIKSNNDAAVADTQKEEDMNIDNGLQDDANNGPIDMVEDNDGHGGLGGGESPWWLWYAG